MRLWGSRVMFALLLALIVAHADGAPTVTPHNSIVTTYSFAPDKGTKVVGDNVELIEPVCAELTAIGQEILKPYGGPTSSISGQSDGVKSLPAVPAAVFMTVMGFLCVSLVRDRRMWLAALAGLLWAGQYGIQVLPQLAVRLAHAAQSQEQVAGGLDYPHRIQNLNRLRSDIEGTQYIGLLHHLAGIPQSGRVAQLLHREAERSRCLGRTEERSKEHQVALAGALFNSVLLRNCLAARARQFIKFSPAFIFDNLARGPPEPA